MVVRSLVRCGEPALDDEDDGPSSRRANGATGNAFNCKATMALLCDCYGGGDASGRVK